MPRVVGCRIFCILIGLAFAGLAVAPAGATAPSGPRLAFVEWVWKKPMHTALSSVGPNGKVRRDLIRGAVEPVPFGGGSWSPDGSMLAFAGSPSLPRGASEDADVKQPKSRIYVVAGEGGVPHFIPGTVGASNPVMSPDGTRIAFSRSREHFHFNSKNPIGSLIHSYHGTSAWIVGLDGSGRHRLTRWRNGLEVSPSSFSPDGRVLALTRYRAPRSPQAIALDLASRATRVLANEAVEPVYSPDGSKLAFVSYRDHIGSEVDNDGDGPRAKSELYTMNATGSDLRRITHTVDWQEEAPSWDPSGQRLAFTRTTGPEIFSFGLTNVIVEANANGSCPRIVYGRKRGDHLGSGEGPGIYAPAWQPGPGREAAPIAC
jgi:Tol biopolymer transport system component